MRVVITLGIDDKMLSFLHRSKLMIQMKTAIFPKTTTINLSSNALLGSIHFIETFKILSLWDETYS